MPKDLSWLTWWLDAQYLIALIIQSYLKAWVTSCKAGAMGGTALGRRLRQGIQHGDRVDCAADRPAHEAPSRSYSVRPDGA